MPGLLPPASEKNWAEPDVLKKSSYLKMPIHKYETAFGGGPGRPPLPSVK